MSEFISISEVKNGDIFLYHGDSFMSRMIRLFDCGDYSHAGIYSDGNILEAIDSGIEYRSVTDSSHGVPFIDVFRFKSKDNTWIGSDAIPVKPVIDRINYYNENREKYGYEQILLLAILVSTRKFPFTIFPGLSIILRNIFESAADILAKNVASGQEPMICSELVYRCYEESGDKYKILIIGADILMGMLHPFKDTNKFEKELMSPMEIDEFNIMRAEAHSFLIAYQAAKREKNVDYIESDTKPFFEAHANYVTPRDLQKSPNLEKLGRLVA